MTTDWLLRVGNGENFLNSSKYRIWGIQSSTKCSKNFMNNVKPGDRLWFIKSNSCGKVIAVATYRSHNKRNTGPLVDTSLTNEELGWFGSGEWDTEVHYSHLYMLTHCELLTHIKGAVVIRKYNEKCRVNLAVEYSYISRYGRVEQIL